MARWLFDNFLRFSDRAAYIVYSIVIALSLMPFSGAEATLNWDWMLLILLRNYVAVLLVVGGLHIWFYGVDSQGNLMRYDTRPIVGRRSTRFKFGYQTWDNMYFTLVSAVPIATIWEIGTRHAFANGWANTLSFSDHPILFVSAVSLVEYVAGGSFLFHSSRFALATAVPARAFYSPPQCEHWTMVRLVDAPD